MCGLWDVPGQAAGACHCCTVSHAGFAAAQNDIDTEPHYAESAVNIFVPTSLCYNEKLSG